MLARKVIIVQVSSLYYSKTIDINFLYLFPAVDCKLNIHRPCSKVLDENCPGPLPQAKRKDPHNDNKISKFMGKIRPRTSSDFIASKY